MSEGGREGRKEGERKRMGEDSNCAKRGGRVGGGGWGGGVMAFGGGRCLTRLADKSEFVSIPIWLVFAFRRHATSGSL